MTRKEFEQLTERYQAGGCTPEERALVEKWVESNFQLESESKVFDSEDEAMATGQEVWAHVRDAAGISRRKVWLAAYKWPVAGAAACIALMLAAGWFGASEMPGIGDPLMPGVETHNTSVSRQRIILPDSSVVTLAEGAGLITSESYGKETRTVRLTGEAFFEIRPNAKVPFLVYCGDLVTEVLGTSFNVKPGQGNKTIEVAVETGRVSVYSSEKDRNHRRSGVIIAPNQKVIYDAEQKTIRQDLVEEPKIVVPDAPKTAFVFDETKVEKVLATLRYAYGTEIVVVNPELNECEFTANLNGFTLFRQLDFLCDAIDAAYEVRGGTIFLTGSGCNPP